MNTLRKLWKSIKRNPVINAVAAAALLQVATDYLAGTIDTNDIWRYLFTVLVGVWARQHTTPAKEAEAKESAAYNKGYDEGGML